MGAKNLKYDPKECAEEAKALLERMHHKKCNIVMAVLGYQDENMEYGCKLLFDGSFEAGPETAIAMATVYAAAIANLHESIESLARSLGKSEGPSSEEAFRRTVAELTNKGSIRGLTTSASLINGIEIKDEEPS